MNDLQNKLIHIKGDFFLKKKVTKRVLAGILVCSEPLANP